MIRLDQAPLPEKNTTSSTCKSGGTTTTTSTNGSSSKGVSSIDTAPPTPSSRWQELLLRVKRPSTPPCPSTRSQRSLSRQRSSILKAWLLQEGFVSSTSARSGRFGRTYYPLHRAVSQNNATLVLLLLEAGADCDCKNSYGQTPADVARLRNWIGSYNEVLSVLESHTVLL